MLDDPKNNPPPEPEPSPPEPAPFEPFPSEEIGKSLDRDDLETRDA
jgi:hypothetical protein